MNVDTAEFEAITGKVGELEATVAYLTRRLELATSTAGILAAAGLAAAMPAPTLQTRRARPRHLRLVPPIGDHS
jgi:hypothetical protein